MKIKFNKNKKELIAGIITCLLIFIIIIWAVKGYAELIQDVSIGKLTFLSVIIIFFVFKLGKILARGLEDIFIRSKK